MSLTGKACPDCAHRQETGGRCERCGHDLFDLANAHHVEFLRELDRRARDRYVDRARKISVAIAMITVFAVWFIPGFWSVRRQYFAIPLLIDQLALMIGLAIVSERLLERAAPRPKFGFLDEDS